MSDPIYKASAGEAIVAEQFNEMQSKLRDLINSHTHDGTPDQGPALQGKAIAGQAKLTVAELTATDKLAVSGKLLLGSNNTDVGDALGKKLDAAGGTIAGSLAVSGKLTVAALDVGEALSKKLDRTSLVSGTVKLDGANSDQYGSGYSCTRRSQGLYDISFSPPFRSVPTVVVTQLFPGKQDDRGIFSVGSAALLGISESQCRIRTGDGVGALADRAFCFIAVGVV
jgi:hypothetical protein